MTARAAILAAVRAVSLPDVALPNDVIEPHVLEGADIGRRFLESARAMGAEVAMGDDGLSTIVRGLPPSATMMSAVDTVRGTVPLTADVQTLSRLDVFICEGILAVAENGAVWIPRSRMGPRAALFLAEHVVIIVEHATIVLDLHEAYSRINPADESFGAFVAGPSKTADIEQSLVIGAHGPKRLTVVLR